MKYMFIMIIVLLVGGCGIEDQPEASRKIVQPNTLAGSWVHEGRVAGEASLITLNLDMKGTFTITGAFADEGYGTWKMGDGNTLVFLYRNKDAVNSTWYIADDPQSGLEVVGSIGRGLPFAYFKKVQ